MYVVISKGIQFAMLQTKERRKENFLAFLMSFFFTVDTRSIIMKNLAVIHWDTNDFLAATAKSSKGIYLTYWY